MVRLLWLLAVLMSGASLAATSGTAADQLGLNIGTLVPDATAWLKTTFAAIGETGLMKGVTRLAQVLIVALVVWEFVGGIAESLNVKRIFKAVLLGGAAFVFAAQAGNHTGFGGYVFDQAFGTWKAVYGATGGNAAVKKINDQIVQDTKTLATELRTFTAMSTLASSSMVYMSDNLGSPAAQGGDPTAFANEATTAVTNTINQASAAQKNNTAYDWMYQIGFVLLIGLFFVYAGAIYLSAWTMISATIALPVGFAYLARGNTRFLSGIIKAYIGSIVTVGLTPVMFSIAVKIVMVAPVAYMKNQVANANIQSAEVVRAYARTMQGCVASGQEADWLGLGGVVSGGCATLHGFLPQMQAAGHDLLKIAGGLAIAMALMMFGLAIASFFISRAPGLVAGFLTGQAGGGAGGGMGGLDRLTSSMNGLNLAFGGAKAALGAGGAAITGGAALAGGLSAQGLNMAGGVMAGRQAARAAGTSQAVGGWLGAGAAVNTGVMGDASGSSSSSQGGPGGSSGRSPGQGRGSSTAQNRAYDSNLNAHGQAAADALKSRFGMGAAGSAGGSPGSSGPPATAVQEPRGGTLGALGQGSAGAGSSASRTSRAGSSRQFGGGVADPRASSGSAGDGAIRQETKHAGALGNGTSGASGVSAVRAGTTSAATAAASTGGQNRMSYRKATRLGNSVPDHAVKQGASTHTNTTNMYGGTQPGDTDQARQAGMARGAAVVQANVQAYKRGFTKNL